MLAMKRLLPWLAVPLVVTAMFLGGMLTAHAAGSHWTSGTSGTHSAGSHSNNPAHVWLAIGADHAGTVTSGGQFHDGCNGNQCFGAFAGSDWAMDIVGTGTSKLYVDYAGWGAGYSPAPDNNKSISFSAYVASSGNFSGSDAACNWKKLEVRATYWGTNGVLYANKPIGNLWLAHMDNSSWVYGNGATVYPNATKANPYGTGTVSWINGIQFASVYNGSGACSTGAHSHLEFFSTHAWGGEFEQHSSLGPDYYSYGHIHGNGTPGSTGYAADSVASGTYVGFLGGGTTSFWMTDNQNYGDH